MHNKQLKHSRKSFFTQTNLFSIFTFLLLILLTSSLQPQQQKSFSHLSQRMFQPQQNQQLYTNLFQKYNEVLIMTKIYLLKGRKQTTLAQGETSLILQQGYLSMYKNKLSPVLKFKLTQQLIQAIQKNSTFVQTTVYLVVDQRRYKLQKKSIPLLGKFKKLLREGIDNWMLADVDLLDLMPEDTMVLRQMDLYFFDMDWILPFQKDSSGTNAFGMFDDFNETYFYPRPISQGINTKLKEKFIPLNKLQQGDTFQLTIHIRPSSFLYPLIMYSSQRLQMLPQDSNYPLQYFNSQQQLFTDNIALAQPYVLRYMQNIILKESIFTWIFFIFQLIALMCSQFATFLLVILEYQIYKDAIKRRGMSLYALMMSVAMNLVIVLVGGLYLRTEEMVVPLLRIVFVLWQIRQMAYIEVQGQFPFLRLNNKHWYNVYANKDKLSFTQCLPPILFFTTLVILDPIIFQNYLTSQSIKSQSPLINYILSRLVETIQTYSFIFVTVPQLLLNYHLKSCNSITWKLLIVLVIHWSVDNFMLPVVTSIADVLFCLKEEIVIGLLILQKIYYGNNLENLKINEDERNQNQDQPQHQEAPEINLNLQAQPILESDQQEIQKQQEEYEPIHQEEKQTIHQEKQHKN